MKNKPKRKLSNLRLGEVSSVKMGDDPEAKVLMFKNRVHHEETAKRMFDEIVAAQEFRQEVMDKLWLYFDSLRESFYAILDDEETYPDSKSALQTTLLQFVDAVKGILGEELPTDFSKIGIDADIDLRANGAFITVLKEDQENRVVNAGSSFAEFDGAGIKKEEDQMSDKDAKTQDQPMTKSEVEAIVKSAVDTAVVAKDAEIARLEKVAALSDVEKAHYNSLKSDEEKDAFLKMDAPARQSIVEKAKSQNEVIIVGGREISKSVVGEDAFFVMKAQQKEIELSKSEATEARKMQKKAEFEKKAEETYAHIPGSTVEKGAALAAIAELPEDVQKTITSVLDAANTALSGVCKTIGHSDVNGYGEPSTTKSEAESELEKRAKALAEKNNVSYEKAYSDILDTKEGAELYQKTLK